MQLLLTPSGDTWNATPLDGRPAQSGVAPVSLGQLDSELSFDDVLSKVEVVVDLKADMTGVVEVIGDVGLPLTVPAGDVGARQERRIWSGAGLKTDPPSVALGDVPLGGRTTPRAEEAVRAVQREEVISRLPGRIALGYPAALDSPGLAIPLRPAAVTNPQPPDPKVTLDARLALRAGSPPEFPSVREPKVADAAPKNGLDRGPILTEHLDPENAPSRMGADAYENRQMAVQSGSVREMAGLGYRPPLLEFEDGSTDLPQVKDDPKFPRRAEGAPAVAQDSKFQGPISAILAKEGAPLAGEARPQTDRERTQDWRPPLLKEQPDGRQIRLTVDETRFPEAAVRPEGKVSGRASLPLVPAEPKGDIARPEPEVMRPAQAVGRESSKLSRAVGPPEPAPLESGRMSQAVDEGSVPRVGGEPLAPPAHAPIEASPTHLSKNSILQREPQHLDEAPDTPQRNPGGPPEAVAANAGGVATPSDPQPIDTSAGIDFQSGDIARPKIMLEAAPAELAVTDDAPRVRHGAPLLSEMRAVHAPPVPSQIAEAIVRLAGGDRGTVDIRLSPEELGTVRFTLTAREDQMHVHIAAERPETVELIRRNIDHLLRDLRDLGHAAVGFSFQGSEGHGARQGHASAAWTNLAQIEPMAAEFPLQASNLATQRAGAGLDLRL